MIRYVSVTLLYLAGILQLILLVQSSPLYIISATLLLISGTFYLIDTISKSKKKTGMCNEQS